MQLTTAYCKFSWTYLVDGPGPLPPLLLNDDSIVLTLLLSSSGVGAAGPDDGAAPRVLPLFFLVFSGWWLMTWPRPSVSLTTAVEASLIPSPASSSDVPGAGADPTERNACWENKLSEDSRPGRLG